jgi:prolycopene isomerase
MKPSRDAYDAVVVGSGLGGLSAAAFLGRAGRRVLLVERREEFGGYAAAFRRGPYTFDPAIHMIAQGERMLLSKVLRYLNVIDEVELLPTGSFYEAVFPDLTMRAPVGFEDYVGAHTALFPGEANGLRAFLQIVDTVHREVHQLPPHLTLRELQEAVERFPTLFKYRTATLADVLDEFLTDPRLKALLGSFWPYFGLPPSKLSFFTFSTPLTTLIREGPFHAHGSTQKLVDAFCTGVERAGGELVAGNGARRIVVEDGRVAGVELDDGTQVQAPVVVSACDARRTFEELVGHAHLPGSYLKKFNRLRPSLSGVVVFAATRLDVRAAGLAHTTFAFRDWDHDSVHDDVLQGRPGGTWLALPSLVDDSLAPAGEHILVLTSLARYEAVPTPEERDAFVDQLLTTFEPVLPGLRENLTFLESATPRTLERFSGNQNGALYGWENSPAQSGSRRLTHRTPVEGLFLCGHWTQPGAGSFRAMFSGVETTMNVLGAGYADQFLQGLELGS